jgi:uncharacterized protein YbaA (DUF1428 family)
MAYYSGFVAAVPTANKAAYANHARDAWPHFQKLGATRMVETWGDNVPDGKQTDMKRAVKAKPDESVVFSWIEWPDKATADKADAAMRDDPAMDEMAKTMPFDGTRMIFGGFAPIYDSKR